MPRRPKNLETVVLALELLRRIPRGRKISAGELHLQLKEFGLSRNLRTIQRPLETLSEDFDIERDAQLDWWLAGFGKQVSGQAKAYKKLPNNG